MNTISFPYKLEKNLLYFQEKLPSPLTQLGESRWRLFFHIIIQAFKLSREIFDLSRMYYNEVIPQTYTILEVLPDTKSIKDLEYFHKILLCVYSVVDKVEKIPFFPINNEHHKMKEKVEHALEMLEYVLENHSEIEKILTDIEKNMQCGD